jgi:hypothetical protein
MQWLSARRPRGKPASLAFTAFLVTILCASSAQTAATHCALYSHVWSESDEAVPTVSAAVAAARCLSLWRTPFVPPTFSLVGLAALTVSPLINLNRLDMRRRSAMGSGVLCPPHRSRASRSRRMRCNSSPTPLALQGHICLFLTRSASQFCACLFVVLACISLRQLPDRVQEPGVWAAV